MYECMNVCTCMYADVYRTVDGIILGNIAGRNIDNMIMINIT